MKKILSILVIACVAMLFVSCEKEGVYNPAKKISKIYFTDANGARNLEESWSWNSDNTLDKIDYYSDGALAYTLNFSYEKKRLVRMNVYSSNLYVDYTYQGNQLKEVALYSNGNLIDTYSFTYENGKISRITDTYFAGKDAVDIMINPLQYVLPNEIITMVDAISQAYPCENPKSTVTSNYELTWDKNNLVKLLRTNTSSDQTITLKAEYDKMANPFYGAMTEIFFENNIANGYFSQNNIVLMESMVTSAGQTATSLANYEYSYEGKYPVSRKLISNNQTTVTEFEYKN
ncbi:MAG: hypothetical protein J5741_03475 [Bacteroidales bacterium]|nr:hypothetical protein [Bacteroidales bacterium]